MIIDKLLQVSDGQAVTASAASTDVIDFGQANPNTGMDDRSKMVITVDESADAAGAATVTFSVQDSADNATFADVAVTGAIGKANLAAGKQVVIPMPTKLRRYCRVYYTVATGPLTAGKFSAQVVTGIQQNVAYPDSPRIA
ncbi:Bbp16 family capsid cement protein [Bordetella hinzii]|uniref:Bbp16 family capsid cement protein n=1 Tax=Bordetella hinzii TaxID=103855 RepID=UPI0039FBFE15